MTHSHWSDRLPYLVPVWHSLSQQNITSSSQNFMDPNLDIDFGGIGMYNNTAQRQYQRIKYKVNRPAMPFYMDSRRLVGTQAGRNCLAYSSKRSILFSCHQNEIQGIQVDVDEKRFLSDDVHDVDCNYSHRFNSQSQPANGNPFCFSTENIWKCNYYILILYFLNKTNSFPPFRPMSNQ